MKYFAKSSVREIMRRVSVIGTRALSSRPSDVDRGLLLRYLERVKCRSKVLEAVRGTRFSSEDASFMRRYRTLQPQAERLDHIIAEMEELRELLHLEEVSTEPEIMVGTWFGEFCSCCCLPLLSQLACSILPTTYQPLFPALFK